MDDVAAQAQALALRRLAGRLDDVARRLAGLPGALAAAWAEPAGWEWADRLELVRREAARCAAESACAADGLPGADRPDGAPGPGSGTADPPAGTAAVPGMRAGGAGGGRTGGRRGVVAPLLPPYGAGC